MLFRTLVNIVNVDNNSIIFELPGWENGVEIKRNLGVLPEEFRNVTKENFFFAKVNLKEVDKDKLEFYEFELGIEPPEDFAPL